MSEINNLNVKDLIQNVIRTNGVAVVLGFATTGSQAMRFFTKRSVKTIIIEKNTKEQFILKPSSRKLLEEAQNLGAAIFFGDEIPEDLKKIVNAKTPIICVISPGISRMAETPRNIKELKIPMIGELELALSLTNIPYILVTGSNGKSTTVTIIDKMLNLSGINSYLCGNIGRPVLALLDEKNLPDVLVVEASSYQLESAISLNPKISVILNLSENHLERHVTMEQYRSAKALSFQHQSKDGFTILNADDKWLLPLEEKIPSTKVFFGSSAKTETSSNYAKVIYNPSSQKDEVILKFQDKLTHFDTSKARLLGEHARFNFAAASIAAILMSASDKAIQEVINTFPGLQHRMERVQTKSDIFAINDSKSTTVASTVAALNSLRRAYPKNPICLLIGGKVKIGSWEPLAKAIKESAIDRLLTRVVCFGGDGQLIYQDLENMGVKSSLAKNVSGGVSMACDWIRAGEIILFSPGCASFDEFLNFEERGTFFKEIISGR